MAFVVFAYTLHLRRGWSELDIKNGHIKSELTYQYDMVFALIHEYINYEEIYGSFKCYKESLGEDCTKEEYEAMIIKVYKNKAKLKNTIDEILKKHGANEIKK